MQELAYRAVVDNSEKHSHGYYTWISDDENFIEAYWDYITDGTNDSFSGKPKGYTGLFLVSTDMNYNDSTNDKVLFRIF